MKPESKGNKEEKLDYGEIWYQIKLWLISKSGVLTIGNFYILMVIVLTLVEFTFCIPFLTEDMIKKEPMFIVGMTLVYVVMAGLSFSNYVDEEGLNKSIRVKRDGEVSVEKFKEKRISSKFQMIVGCLWVVVSLLPLINVVFHITLGVMHIKYLLGYMKIKSARKEYNKVKTWNDKKKLEQVSSKDTSSGIEEYDEGYYEEKESELYADEYYGGK